MTHQETKLRLEDLWEHLSWCYQEWQQADEDGMRFLTDCLKRDLDECRRLCDRIGVAEVL